MVGLLLVVRPKAGLVMVTAGAMVSRVNQKLTGLETLPALSVACRWTAWPPSAVTFSGSAVSNWKAR